MVRAAVRIACAMVFVVMATSGQQVVAQQALPSNHGSSEALFARYCVGCHNNDDLDGELSVETFKLLIQGGENGTPIKSGDRAASLLAKVITKQVKPHMPPSKEPQPAPAQGDTFLRWIDQGAKPPTDDRSILAT